LDSYRKQKKYANMDPASITPAILKEMIEQIKSEGDSK